MHEFGITRLEHLIIAMFLTSLGTAVVSRKRKWNRVRWMGGRCEKVWLVGVFVFTHVTAYYLLGIGVLHSSRVAALISLHGLSNMFA